MITHLDLFSGVGGFAYAADQVWDDVEHIFCDNEPFAQEVIKKHWPGSYIYNDIRTITDTGRKHGEPGSSQDSHGEAPKRGAATEEAERLRGIGLVTGGFPCQPFSAAGKRRGTEDNRYLWPEMLRVIRLTKPEWVIAENVRGLASWNEGMVLEQVCTDLEADGYEVQPFIIPAVAVNAPHRRDRIWFLARNPNNNGLHGTEDPQSSAERDDSHEEGQNKVRQPQGADTLRFETSDWNKDWMEVAAEFCSVDDGLPKGLRKHQLNAYGNAIVPQIAIEIFKVIREALGETKPQHQS